MTSGDSKVVSEDFIEISTFNLLNQFKGMERKKIFESEIENGQNFVLTSHWVCSSRFESINSDLYPKFGQNGQNVDRSQYP